MQEQNSVKAQVFVQAKMCSDSPVLGTVQR